MKKILLLTAALVSTTVSAAGSDGCETLYLRLVNNTGASCILRDASVYGGGIIVDGVPQEIPNNSISPRFRVKQGSLIGAIIRLDYQCGNKRAILNTTQSYCFLSAGNISGDAEGEGRLASYLATPGSYWNASPGQITWILN